MANNHKNYYRYHNGKKEVRKFCSKECADLARTKPRETRICLNCGKEFKVLPMPSRAGSDLLCSKKCQYEYYSGDKAFRWDGGRVEVKCANCNKTMFMARSRYDRSKEHFCSPGCYGEYYSGMSLLERYGEEKAKKISQKL